MAENKYVRIQNKAGDVESILVGTGAGAIDPEAFKRLCAASEWLLVADEKKPAARSTKTEQE